MAVHNARGKAAPPTDSAVQRQREWEDACSRTVAEYLLDKASGMVGKARLRATVATGAVSSDSQDSSLDTVVSLAGHWWVSAYHRDPKSSPGGHGMMASVPQG
jgi:hypothetical protein